ncbi:hypothetical protein D9M68_815730 [compost metagenome]
MATGGVAVDVAGISLLHQFVVDTGVLQRQANGFGTHLDVGTALTGLGELNHADTGDVGFLRHLFLLRMVGSPQARNRDVMVARQISHVIRSRGVEAEEGVTHPSADAALRAVV